MTAYKTNVALQLSIKKLDIYQGSFIWLSILSSLAAPITLGWAGVRRPGLGWANTVGWAVNGLWEDRPVDEWTPELMGSVSTKLLRKENPSQGSHCTFYFYCTSHRLFSSAGFRGGSRRVPPGAQESKERTFFGPVYWIWDMCTEVY